MEQMARHMPRRSPIRSRFGNFVPLTRLPATCLTRTTMANSMQTQKSSPLRKCATGIPGLDAVTGGGLPAGRPTLVCGAAGCGKTLLAVEFLVRGATLYDEPGVFMAFEETAEELSQNVRSLGFDLDDLIQQNKLA